MDTTLFQFFFQFLFLVIYVIDILSIACFPFFQRFEKTRARIGLDFFSTHAVEYIEQKNDKQDDHDDCRNHQVELQGILIEQGSTSFQLPVLPTLFLQIKVYITIVITLRLVIESRIHQAESLSDGSHEIRSLLDVIADTQGTNQTVASRVIVLDGEITLRQSAVSSGNLISISIGKEQIEGTLSQVARQKGIRHLFYIQILDGREIVPNQEITHF